ncbi:hypothetical protein BB561_005526 [Smittium simulii]|uniref:Uncharacterized protein n=1 Tax=Smittium simulii TaxID=133385 RepID=A0A2T9Y9X5_9FUNG|nr:hypothetical protein BB561_005526 [Smittium simulii]
MVSGVNEDQILIATASSYLTDGALLWFQFWIATQENPTAIDTMAEEEALIVSKEG